MKYPIHTDSQPLVGAAAKRVVRAVKEGKVLSNAQARQTAARIAKQIAREKK